jgi:hypothetical protein
MKDAKISNKIGLRGWRKSASKLNERLNRVIMGISFERNGDSPVKDDVLRGSTSGAFR